MTREGIAVELGRSGMSQEAREALVAELDQLFGPLDHREAVLVDERMFAEAPKTLEELGAEIGVTRERVRQLEKDLLERLKARTMPSVSPLLCDLAEQLLEALGRVIPAMDGLVIRLFSRLVDCDDDGGSGVRVDPARLALIALWIAGLRETSFRGSRYWGDAKGLFAVVDSALDSMGMLTPDQLAEILVELGVKEVIFAKMVDDDDRLRFMGGRLVRWGRSQGDDAATVLSLMGEPCSLEVIIEELGRPMSPRSLTNRLIADDRFVRASKTTFGLKEWGGLNYGGITDAIRHELELAGGEDFVEGLAVRISEKYGVAKTSVRAYLEAPAFVVAEGRARLRGPNELFMNQSDPRKAYRIFKHVDGFSMVMTVDGEVLRGSGRPLTKSMAAAVGLEAGSDLVFGRDDNVISLMWPMTSPIPTMGSTRLIAQGVGAQAGDLVRIDVRGDAVVAVKLPSDITTAPPSREALSALVGIEPGIIDWVERLRMALGAGPSEDLVRVAAEKDDELLVRLIPDEFVARH